MSIFLSIDLENEFLMFTFLLQWQEPVLGIHQ